MEQRKFRMPTAYTILFCLIIIPLLTMISNTFTLAQGELRRVQGHVGDFTLYYWKYILTGTMANAVLWGPLKNSFVCGFFTVLVSVPLGSVLAWLMIRTDIPGKKILGLLVTVPYMIPSWTKALAWLAMFRNSTSGAFSSNAMTVPNATPSSGFMVTILPSAVAL